MDEIQKVAFTEEAVKTYLDAAITFWRGRKIKDNEPWAKYYVDAFQSVRSSLFGETLPVKEIK